jgi:hypothetical protein
MLLTRPAAVHPQSGRAITAASSVRAPASIMASGKTVLVIAPSARRLLVKLPIILVSQVMHGPGLPGRANQRGSGRNSSR